MKQKRKDFIIAAHGAACTNWKEDIEKEFPKLFQKTWSIGQIFRLKNGSGINEYYILAKCYDDGESNITVALIGLLNGNFWVYPVDVKDCSKITKIELIKIQLSGDFERAEIEDTFREFLRVIGDNSMMVRFEKRNKHSPYPDNIDLRRRP